MYVNIRPGGLIVVGVNPYIYIYKLVPTMVHGASRVASYRRYCVRYALRVTCECECECRR